MSQERIVDCTCGKCGKKFSAPVQSGVSSPEKSLQATKIPDNVWRVMRHKARNIEGHPGMFSVGLPEFAMKCWPGIAYEPFAGSGTTIIAAHRLKRRAFGIELEPVYCSVILARCEAEGLAVARAES
jgi:DNA modification methylase